MCGVEELLLSLSYSAPLCISFRCFKVCEAILMDWKLSCPDLEAVLLQAQCVPCY